MRSYIYICILLVHSERKKKKTHEIEKGGERRENTKVNKKREKEI